MKTYKTPDNLQPSGFSIHSLDDGVSPEYVHNFPVDRIEITEAEADAIRAANAPALTYADLRAAEYAKKSIGEQLDMQYWDRVNGTTLWRDWIASIKAQFPKT